MDMVIALLAPVNPNFQIRIVPAPVVVVADNERDEVHIPVVALVVDGNKENPIDVADMDLDVVVVVKKNAEEEDEAVVV